MNTIQKFIKDNNIDISGSGSGLNSSYVILAGFSLYLYDDTDNVDKVLEDIQENGLYNLSIKQESEFIEVFDYAYVNNYCLFWVSPEAQIKYIFELKKEDKK